MMRRVTLVLLCASPFVGLEVQAGRGAELGHIELTLLDDHATGYGTFQSHNQKVVANRRGIFTSHIHCMKSRDGGTTWETLTGQPLTPPIVADDAGPTDRITLDDEFDVHTWLSSFMAKDGKLHFLYQARTQAMPRQHYVRYDILTGKKDLDTQPRFGGQTISINRLDGFFAADRGKPGTPLYCVASDLTHSKQLACVVSRDNGGTWHDHARSTAESDVMYAIGGCRDVTRDGFILGTFTDAPSGGNSSNVPVQFFRVPKSP